MFESDYYAPYGTIYQAYEELWLIEMVFRYYRDVNEFDEMWMHSDYSEISSEFVCFLLTIVTGRLLKRFDAVVSLNGVSYSKAMKILERAKKVRLDCEWMVVRLTVKDAGVLRELGLFSRLITVKNPVAAHARNVTEDCIVIQIGNLSLKDSYGQFTYPVGHGRAMTGILVDDMVEVRDQSEGSRLYTRGNYGYPRSGGGVDLDLVEATYLSECGRLDVEFEGESVAFEDLFMHSASVYDDFDIRYLVYRDLRQRGFVVKAESGDFDLSVFPRGKTLSDSRPEYYVKAVSENSPLEIHGLISQVMDADARGRRVLYGVADEEGDVTYYRMYLRDPSGTVFPDDPGSVPEGWLVRDRISSTGRRTPRPSAPPASSEKRWGNSCSSR